MQRSNGPGTKVEKTTEQCIVQRIRRNNIIITTNNHKEGIRLFILIIIKEEGVYDI